jgi:Tfp pilus assembly protein PilX
MKEMTFLPKDERGIALVITMLVVLEVGALATGAALVGANHLLISRHYDRQSTLEAAADAGLEYARAQINADKSLYPTTGYNALESNAPVSDAVNGTIHGVKRSTYVGPSGATSGQYGVFGSIITVVTDDGGGMVVRRSEVSQESFAKFAYFTDVEPSNISFGGGDAIFGPVHTNDYLKIYSSGAFFYSSTRTAKTIQGAPYGYFAQGYGENVPVIPMPTTADLNGLRTQAMAGQTRIVGNSDGSAGRATTRIEFVAIDINGDGENTDDNEGFMRVYQSLGGSRGANYVSGLLNVQQWAMWNSVTCGTYDVPGGTFTPAAALGGSNSTRANKLAAAAGRRRCYLGGHDSIYGGFTANPPDDPTAGGGWLVWPGAVDPTVAAARAVEGDAAYLWPISRRFNPDFKGVIFVDGKVGVSGVVRGRITIAATDDIVLLDDLTYATDPGLGTCEDIVGIFSGDDIRIAENPLNAPWRPSTNYGYYTFDDTKDEFFHNVLLALDIFTTQDYFDGSGHDEWCETVDHGRGCLYLTGGIIQRTRGAVGTLWGGGGGAGYVKRYAYDPCAAKQPPPYFPTTGHFVKGQYYEIDPSGFDIDSYFQMITQGISP